MIFPHAFWRELVARTKRLLGGRTENVHLPFPFAPRSSRLLLGDAKKRWSNHCDPWTNSVYASRLADSLSDSRRMVDGSPFVFC